MLHAFEFSLLPLSHPGGNQVDGLSLAASDDDGVANNHGDADGNQRHKILTKTTMMLYESPRR